MAATSANYRGPLPPIVRACSPPPRAAIGKRSRAVWSAYGSPLRLHGSAPLLRTPPAARALPRSWRPGLWGLGSACPARFCVLGGCLRRGRAARPLLWAVFGPRLWALLACAPSPRRIASRARLARCPPLSALAGAGRLPGPGLLWAPAGGRRYRPPVALWPPWAVPPPGIPSAAPPPSLGSWFGVGSRVLRGASAAQGAQSRAEMWTEGDKLDSPHRARIDRPGAATAPKQPSTVGYQLRY